MLAAWLKYFCSISLFNLHLSTFIDLRCLCSSLLFYRLTKWGQLFEEVTGQQTSVIEHRLPLINFLLSLRLAKSRICVNLGLFVEQGWVWLLPLHVFVVCYVLFDLTLSVFDIWRSFYLRELVGRSMIILETGLVLLLVHFSNDVLRFFLFRFWSFFPWAWWYFCAGWCLIVFGIRSFVLL